MRKNLESWKKKVLDLEMKIKTLEIINYIKVNIVPVSKYDTVPTLVKSCRGIIAPADLKKINLVI